jgi:hypothetical protein
MHSEPNTHCGRDRNETCLICAQNGGALTTETAIKPGLAYGHRPPVPKRTEIWAAATMPMMAPTAGR